MSSTRSSARDSAPGRDHPPTDRDTNPDRDVCPLRNRGCSATLPQPSWRLESTHLTSQGEIEYCRCSCGARVILHNGELSVFISSDGVS
ncbi:hypothetical protein [Streptomyces sp. I6]|uniref:hypothetical protein n=1 Tax=Streptomyces sp. I6 TaxID=2483113 RepID=UPI0011CD46F1|nr:hypothetical protein [Streptomyces sp. I6]